MADENMPGHTSVNNEVTPPLLVKNKVLKTAALLADVLITGMLPGVLGSTVVSVELLLGVSTSQIALALVIAAIGYTFGSILAGLLYDRMNKELVFTLILIWMGASFGPAPLGLNLYAYIICLVLLAIGMGMNIAGIQPYILMLWSGHRLKGSMVQMIQLGFSIGGAVGPLVAKPFLPDLSFLEKNCTKSADNFTNTSRDESMAGEINNASATSYCPERQEIQDTVAIVRFAYIAISVLFLLPSVLFAVAFFLGEPSFLTRSLRKSGDAKQDGKELVKNRKFRIKLLTGGFVLFFLYQPVEGSLGVFLAVFVVKGLGWPNGHGSLITSVFWAALCVGRGLGIPAAAFFTPARMLMGILAVTFVGTVLLMFSPYHDTFVWIGAAVAGTGVAPFFGTAFVWFSQHINVTGRVSAVFHVATAVAGMTQPLLVGYLLDNIGHMTLPYYVTAAAAALAITFSCLESVVRYHGRRKELREHADKKEHIDVTAVPKETEMTLLSST